MGTKPFAIRAGIDGPSPPPHTGNAELERYVYSELNRLYGQIQLGMVQGLELEVIGFTPKRTFDGMVHYFREGVVGAQRGMYLYTEGAWKYVA